MKKYPPPPFLRKNGGIKSSIFGFGGYKKFWRDFGIDPVFQMTIGRPSANSSRNNHNWILKKYVFLGHYKENLRTFFSKSDFGPKWHKNVLKWFFTSSLGPKDYLHLFLDQFGKTKILIFVSLNRRLIQ